MALMAFPEPARRLVALRVLGMLTSDLLPEVALHLLPLGSSASAGALAGATPADSPGERAELFERALAELGLETPSRIEAAHYLKRQFANDAVTGALSPLEAATRIREVYDEVCLEMPRGPFVGSELGVAEVIGLYYAFDGVGTLYDANELERELLAALEAVALAPAEP